MFTFRFTITTEDQITMPDARTPPINAIGSYGVEVRYGRPERGVIS